jgi:hypothetical protein
MAKPWPASGVLVARATLKRRRTAMKMLAVAAVAAAVLGTAVPASAQFYVDPYGGPGYYGYGAGPHVYVGRATITAGVPTIATGTARGATGTIGGRRT